MLNVLRTMSASRFTLQVISILACLCIATITSNAQDSCSDALKDIRIELLKSNNATSKEVYKRDFYRMTASEAYREYKRLYDMARNNEFGIAGSTVIEALPVGGNLDYKKGEHLDEEEFLRQFQIWRESIAEKIEHEQFYDSSNYWKESKIENNSINKWGECMARRSNDLFVHAYRDGEFVSVHVFYTSQIHLPIQLEFVLPGGVKVNANREGLEILNSKTFSLTFSPSAAEKYRNGFSLAVNGSIYESNRRRKVGDFSKPGIIVGPATLSTLPIEVSTQLRVNRPIGNSSFRGQDILVDFDPITLAKGEKIKSIALTLLDVQKNKVVRHEPLEPQARTANFQLHYLENPNEHNNRYPKDYDNPRVDGIVYIPRAQFEVTVTLEGGRTHKARSGEFEIDRRPR